MKIGTGAKIATLTVAAPVNAGIGLGIGHVAGVDPGWKRSLIAGGATLVETGITLAIKPIRPLWWAILTGGALGALALLAEPSIRKWWATRQAKIDAEKAKAQTDAQQAEQEETFSVPPAQQPPQQQVVVHVPQQPAPVRKPTTIEQLMPAITTFIGAIPGAVSAFGGLGSVKATAGTFRNRNVQGTAGTFKRIPVVMGSGAVFAKREYSLYNLARN